MFSRYENVQKCDCSVRRRLTGYPARVCGVCHSLLHKSSAWYWYSYCVLVGYDIVQSGRWPPTLPSDVVSPSLLSHKKPKRQQLEFLAASEHLGRVDKVIAIGFVPGGGGDGRNE